MRNLFTAFILITMLCSCDSFSTTLVVEDVEYRDQMVVGSIISNRDMNGTTEFYVGKNRPALDSDDFSAYNLSGASLSIEKLSTDEFLVDFIERQQEGNTYNYASLLPDSFYEPGDYRFRVEHPDYTVSETLLEFPEPSLIENFKFDYESGTDLDGSALSRVSFDVIDEAGVENYYSLSIEIDGRTVRPSTLELAGSEGSDSRILLFSDVTFDGQRKRIDVGFDRFFWNPNTSEEITLSWSSVNEGYYLLSKTVRLQQSAEDNPFSSAVQIHSNVNEALGVIAFQNTRTDTLRP